MQDLSGFLLAILDALVPGMTGPEMLEEMKRHLRCLTKEERHNLTFAQALRLATVA